MKLGSILRGIGRILGILATLFLSALVKPLPSISSQHKSNADATNKGAMRPQAISLAARDGLGYEPKDIKVPYVIGTGALVMTILAAMLLFLAWLEPILFHGGRGGKSPILWGEPLPVAVLPEEPRLELSPETDYEVMKKAWSHDLTTYRRAPSGQWRIPISKAMEEVATRPSHAEEDRP